METAHRIASLARDRGLELVATGVPKTIDNDLGDEEFRLIDHAPGYGSAAPYWASVVQDLEEENRGMGTTERVCVVQAMGRSAGFLPAAARLGDPERRMPLLIFCAESGHTLASLAELVNQELVHRGRCIAVVSEGFSTGGFAKVHDAFGHVDFGASGGTAAQAVVNHLNDTGLKARGYATGQVPGVLQRSTALYASTVDRAEAFTVGQQAVEIAVRDGTGWMATILRAPGDGYRSVYDRVPLEKVAGRTRRLPARWLAPGGTDVTDEFISYARPLIGEQWAPVPLEGGLQRFARLDVRFIEQKLPRYLPVLHRRTAR
jgi:6-phosphofructokinase 1